MTKVCCGCRLGLIDKVLADGGNRQTGVFSELLNGDKLMGSFSQLLTDFGQQPSPRPLAFTGYPLHIFGVNTTSL